MALNDVCKIDEYITYLSKLDINVDSATHNPRTNTLTLLKGEKSIAVDLTKDNATQMQAVDKFAKMFQVEQP